MSVHKASGRTALIALLAVSSLPGCAEYVDRKNTIAFSAGNAVQTNIVTHVPDPWPAHSRYNDIAFNGERMQRAVERYRCGPPASGGNGGGFNSLTVNVNGGSSSPQSQGQDGNC